MTGLQKFLLVPCLSPVVVAVLVASLNGNQPTSLRFLTWRSSTLPIGAWIALASTGAALFSGLASLSASAGNQPLRRQVHRPMGWDRSNQNEWNPEPERSPFTPHRQTAEPERTAATAWPERDIRDPAPTVAVPFRVIQRGRQSGERQSAPTATAEDNISSGEAQAITADDWDQPLSEDW